MEENVKRAETVANEATPANDEILVNVSYANILKKLLAEGCKRINDIRVKNVNVTEKDNYTMINEIV